MKSMHRYEVPVSWTGNRGYGTSGYCAYDRDHEVAAAGRPVIAASSEPLFRGDAARRNPELELVAALSQCHTLWYLHLRAAAGVVVISYTDHAEGTMAEADGGSGRFTDVVLRPRIAVASPDMIDAAAGLHREADAKCFIASSVSFPVRNDPMITAAGPARDPAGDPGSLALE